MIQSLYTAYSALMSGQRNVDTIGNNVANINTDGFKRTRVDFRDAIYARIQSPTDNSPPMNLQFGRGVLPYQMITIMEQGPLLESGGEFDLALQGPGFYALETPQGGVVYSRNSQFSLSVEGDLSFVVDQNGYYLLDTDGDRIFRITAGTRADNGMVWTDVPAKVTEDGEFLTGAAYYPALGADTAVDYTQRIAVVKFENPAGLLALQNGYFVPSENSGAPYAAALGAETIVKQGYREGSNVDYAEETTRLIRAQRAMQLAARAVTTADEMAQTANAIRQ